MGLAILSLSLRPAVAQITQNGGTVNNSSPINTAGTAITLTASGTVNNSGQLTAGNYGILIQGDGTVVDSNTITTSGNSGIYITGNGSVTQTIDHIDAHNYGVRIDGNGTVNNSAEIVGEGNNGLYIGGNGTLVNSGTIGSNTNAAAVIVGFANVTNTDALTATGGDGLDIDGSTTVYSTIVSSSSGNIQGNAGIQVGEPFVTSALVNIDNAGTVTGTGNSAIVLWGVTGQTNTVINEASGLINGSTNGIILFSGLGQVINHGIIMGSNDGIDLDSGGTVTNTSTITGSNNNGVYVQSGTATINNLSGTITGNNMGIWLSQGGNVTSSGTITGVNDGIYITGITPGTPAIVQITGGSVGGTNNAALFLDGDANVTTSGSAFIAGANNGILVNGVGNILATGFIEGSLHGIYVGGNNSSLTVGAGGIVGSNAGTGAYFSGSNASVTVASSGTIEGVTGDGVYFASSGTVNNAGTISSDDQDGINLGSGTVFSSGSIIGGPTGINATGPVAITLQGGGIVSDVYAIHTANANSNITIIGRAQIYYSGGSFSGQMVNSAGTGTFRPYLVGMTPSQAAAWQAANGNTSGDLFAGPNGYIWQNYTLQLGAAISLEQVVDPGLHDIATRIDNLTTPLALAYDPLYTAAAFNPEAALNQLTGREIDNGIDTLGVNAGTTLTSSIVNRLDLVRGGATGGFDFSSLRIGSSDLVAFTNTSAQLSSLLDLSSGRLGGTEMSTDTRQAKEMSSAAEPPLWGAWASGTVTLSDQSATGTSNGFHATTGSPTIGIDCRITPHFLLGALANYSTVGANFSDGSRLGNEGGLFGLYGAWHQAGWHVYGVAAGGYSSYDIDRKTLAGAIAHAHPGSSNAISDFTGGYDLALTRTLTFTPELGLTYTHLGVDGYSEAGAGAFNLIVGQQDIDSLRTHLGGRLATTFQWNGVTFMPEIRAAWYHEFLDDSRGVSTSLPGAPTLGSFAVQTNDTERDFALVGIGLNTAFTGAGLPMAAFINYDVQAGQDNFIAHNIDAGFRVSF
jgi:uncharacterized protein YhjY with autotransporter beta-barrel domain